MCLLVRHSYVNKKGKRLVDGETGSSFTVENVPAQLGEKAVSIEHPVIQFSSIKRLIGIKYQSGTFELI